VLGVLVRAFRTPDLRKKLLFTGAMIVLFRFGSNLPTPGISEQNVSYCSRMATSGGVFAILNLLRLDVDELANVVSFAEAVDRRHVLVRMLRRLPDIQREVLVCRYLLDATVAETATALDIAEGTVKSAASRGLDQLRQLLYDEEKRDRRVHPC
jgi:RNA polymerase sigma factor (sigma-70 family)